MFMQTSDQLDGIEPNPTDACLDAYTQALIDGPRRDRSHMFSGKELAYYRLGQRDADPAMGGDDAS